jgi:hypothetical protein
MRPKESAPKYSRECALSKREWEIEQIVDRIRAMDYGYGPAFELSTIEAICEIARYIRGLESRVAQSKPKS